MTPGPLALIGGNEFTPGNEGHDRLLVEAAGRLGDDRPAFVIATAAVRQDPDRAVRTAVDWYRRLGLGVEELPLRGRRHANSEAIAARARAGRFFVFAGGDPGLVVSTLLGTPAWDAILEAWRGGAVLAGSSAGAMALGEWTAIRARHPGDSPARAPTGARGCAGCRRGAALRDVRASLGGLGRGGAARRTAGPGRTLLLGVDERSAALWLGGGWLAGVRAVSR